MQLFGSPLRRAEQAQETVLRCFADAVGADSGAILARHGDGLLDGPVGSLRELMSTFGDRIVTTWSRRAGPVGISQARTGLLSNALTSDAPIVDLSGGNRRFDHGAPFAVAASIRPRGNPAGVLYAGFGSAPELESDELAWTADSYAATAALCLIDSGAIASTLRAAGFDGLTGCLGPSGFLDAVTAEISRSERHNHHLCCALVDLDGFKAVNDRRGHLTGNRVLEAVAEGIRLASRRYDVVGRLGGDEFVIFLPQTDLHAASCLAARMSKTLAAAAADVTDVPVRASIGLAEWHEGMSARAAVEAADKALREAKGSGGDRVVAAAAPHYRVMKLRHGLRGLRAS